MKCEGLVYVEKAGERVRHQCQSEAVEGSRYCPLHQHIERFTATRIKKVGDNEYEVVE